MVESRVFFSLTSILMLFWMPYDYMFLITIAHVLLLINIGAGATIPLLVSFIIFFILGLYKTRKDPNWFSVIIGYLRFYKNSPDKLFKKKIKYVA